MQIRKNNVEKIIQLNKGSHCIQVDDDYIELEVSDERKLSLQGIEVRMSKEEVGTAYFKKYAYLDEIFIGSSEYSDIQVCSNDFLDIHCVINTKNKTIVNKTNESIYVNKQKQSNFEEFDVLTIYTLIMVITAEYILVNTPSNIRVNLGKYHEKRKCVHCLTKQNVLVSKHRFVPLIVPLTIQFKQIHELRNGEKQPLLLLMFPMMIMSLASFSTGLLMTYQGYMQGREFIEVLPSLIMPLTMILGTICIHPIQRLVENKRIKKNKIKMEIECSDYCHEIELKIEKYIEQIREYNKICFPIINTDNYLNYDHFFSKVKTDNDFLWLPVGIGDFQPNIEYKTNNVSEGTFYEQCIKECINKFKVIHNELILLNVNEFRRVNTNSKDFMFYLLSHLLTLYSPNDLKIIILADDNWIEQYPFLLFFPHLSDESKKLVYSNVNDIEIGDSKRQICFNFTSKNIYLNTISCIQLSENNSLKSNSDAVVIVEKDNNILLRKDGTEISFKPLFTHTEINFLKKFFNTVDFSDVSYIEKRRNFDISNCRKPVQLEELWKNNKTYLNLKVPIGFDNNGKQLYLDLGERSDGPHMLIASTTGGGKSEAIITILSSLAMTFSYEYFQFIVVDFKGGGLEHSFNYHGKVIPHCIGVMSNLNEYEVERFFISIRLEANRRQKMFNEVNRMYNLSSMDIDKYQKICDSGKSIEIISHLFVVIDEFAELKVAYPEQMGDLIQIARIGRSLGIHLILSTQKPANVVDGQIWANCKTKICLKVQDKQDSLEMIQSEDAFYLKKSGEFIQSTDGILKKGSFYYLSQPVLEEGDIDMEVQNFRFEKHKITKKNNQFYLDVIMEKLVQLSDQKDRSLWCKPLTLQFVQENCPKHAIGLIDDIFKNRQIPLEINDENVLCFSLNQKAIEDFVCTYLYQLTECFDYKQEVFVIGESVLFAKMANSSCFIHSIDTQEKIANLLKLLKNKVHHARLIVLNWTWFQEMCNKLDIDFGLLINDIFTCNTSLMLFANSSSSFRYTYWNYFSKRITLSISSIQELSQIFETSFKMKVVQKDACYIQLDNVCYFKFKEVTIEDVVMKQNNIYQFKKSEVPFMPEQLIAFDIYQFARSYTTYKWLSIQDFKTCIFISKDRYSFKKWIENSSIFTSYTVIQYFNESVEISFNSTINVIHVREKDWFEFLKGIEVDNLNIFWFGRGFETQYIIPIKKQVQCSEKEGVLYIRGSIEKVRFIDGLS